MQISDDEYREIEGMIESSESPVGIDAKKTHVIIIHKLNEIEKRLDKLEKRDEEFEKIIKNDERDII